MAKKVEIPEPIIPNDSWKIVELGKYVNIVNGYPFDSKRFTNSQENTYPLIRIRDVVRGYTETFTNEDCPDEYKIKSGEILIGMDGDFNIAKWKSDIGLLNQRVCKISSNSSELDENFLFFYLPIPLKQINDATPSVTVKHLSSTSLQKLHFPLPTLAEQQRIVNRIETMFAKLDQAQEKAQTVLDSFETRKAAILHKAFTGELTAKWRKENGVADESWEEKTIGECCKSLKYGTAKKSESSGKVAVLRMGNLQHGEIEYDDLVFSNDEDDIKKYLLAKGDVLFNRTNSPEWVGKTSIYRGDIPAIYAGYLIKLDYDKLLLIGDYLNYILNSPNAKEYCNSVKTDGVNQSNINAQKIGAYKIPLPTLPEQQEIVRILDSVLEKEADAKSAAERVLEQIALLKKSILARAFRGEL